MLKRSTIESREDELQEFYAQLRLQHVTPAWISEGTTVEHTGRAHVDGYSELKLLNITPGRPVVLLRRMDYVYGDYELEMSVNGKTVNVVSCVGTDRVDLWRNWPVKIPAEYVTDGTMLLRQQSITAGRDINSSQASRASRAASSH